MVSLPFRFNADTHTYVALDTGEEIPHITGLLKSGGWVDDTWFTEESCERGRAVHSLTADYDLGALELDGCQSAYRGYLIAHAKAMGIIRPTWELIEVPLVHPVYRFAGRPDRAGEMYQLKAVNEVKSGDPQKGHYVQTALQAILVAPMFGLPPEAIARFAEYVTEHGRAKVDRHVKRADFDEAYRLLRKYAA